MSHAGPWKLPMYALHSSIPYSRTCHARAVSADADPSALPCACVHAACACRTHAITAFRWWWDVELHKSCSLTRPSISPHLPVLRLHSPLLHPSSCPCISAAAAVYVCSDGTLADRSYENSGKYQKENDLQSLIQNWRPSDMLPKMYLDREIHDGPAQEIIVRQV